MKIAFFLFLATLLFLGSALSAEVGAKESRESQQARLQEIGERALDGNDPQALAEAATLPRDIAIPFLSRYLWSYEDQKGAYFDAARRAMMNIPGYEKYFADKLAAASRRGGVDNETFDLLSLIGTPEAAAVVAPYLFDFSMTPGDGHIRAEVNAASAAWALGKMNLGDAPARPGFHGSAGMIAWQKWAIGKGLVPRTRKAEVPVWLVAIESGPIKMQIITHPETVSKLLQSGNYKEILDFVRAAYAERNDETARYAYLMVLSQVPAAMRIPLAIDFTLDVPDLELNAQGARVVRLALLEGASLTTAGKKALTAKLKAKLSGLRGGSRPEFDFARFAADALMFLGEDAGLDVFLTDAASVETLKRRDGWTAASDEEVFARLEASYRRKAAGLSEKDRGADTLAAAMYELCRVRRSIGSGIKPLHPLADLGKLLPK